MSFLLALWSPLLRLFLLYANASAVCEGVSTTSYPLIVSLIMSTSEILPSKFVNGLFSVFSLLNCVSQSPLKYYKYELIPNNSKELYKIRLHSTKCKQYFQGPEKQNIEMNWFEKQKLLDPVMFLFFPLFSFWPSCWLVRPG